MQNQNDTASNAIDLAMKITALVMAGVALYEAFNALKPATATDCPTLSGSQDDHGAY